MSRVNVAIEEMRPTDWEAVRDGYEPGDLIGRGVSKEMAIADLLALEKEGAA